MEFNISREKILEVAKRYGLEVSFDGSREPGFYVNGEKIEIEDLFPELDEMKTLLY